MDKKTYQTILLAGLLHDIGKFLQRSGYPKPSNGGRHPHYSADFIKKHSERLTPYADPKLLTELVQRHHESDKYPADLQVKNATEAIQPLAQLISRADNYSSYERGEWAGQGQDYRTVPLASVLSRVSLERQLAEMTYYDVGLFSPEQAFPRPERKNDLIKLTHHRECFEHAFIQIFNNGKKTFQTIYTHLLNLMQVYAWCIPSNTLEDIPDVSLFDHLKTTSAIAACLYQYHQEKGFIKASIMDNEKEKFLLVVGDLSGIQKYIFDIAHGGSGGVSKRLRARSFLLSVLSDAVSQQILQTFDLPQANILMTSGGKFYVLLPQLADVGERLQRLQATVEQELFQRFHGVVTVNLAWTSLSGKEFKHFGNVLHRLAGLLQEKKARPLQTVLTAEQVWQTEQFVHKLQVKGSGQVLCDGCQKAFAEESGAEENFCSACAEDLKMGSSLTKARYIAFSSGLKQHFNEFQLLNGIVLSLHEHPDTIGLSNPFLVQKLNSPTIQELGEWPALSRYYANYVPVNEAHSTISFDELAKMSKGKPYIGYLKADVDQLGAVVVFGLMEEGHNWNSVSRITTLSRMLDLFFAGWVEKTLRERYPQCYTVFSGGDDLFLVGPWSDLTWFAKELRQEFSRFCGNNPNLTLSAGLVTSRPKVPIARMADQAEWALEKAKEIVLPGQAIGRNQFCAFDTVFKWEHGKLLFHHADCMIRWIEGNIVSLSSIRNLQTYSRYFQDFLWNRKMKTEGLRYIPLLAYDIGRNYSDSYHPEQQMVKAWLETLFDYQKNNPVLHYLDFILGYAIMATRKESA
ncbi:type III-A CRISPR-associated protein Cas10/Csm1 [Heliobacterium gestii]|uniref:CRISPR system single-strand-specific deoxyribonuclease Cas10/Csm1 (subtype III-A) n=1 Tax=Heliomicrobium gestii TaxID=2699 RepID=A0A845LC17_HELGE|nr:type III-A CRISPR-associated protein Cas10/Csm1 [Heliomicrobium gestii]MBM7865800.1 CRISPR-associated protein Csm1 [Heliomicrobium gestii]MZP42045.1 type III-A CRISPR-associated protein Cas10/Csm1 [Heliomicrobium gestii]